MSDDVDWHDLLVHAGHRPYPLPERPWVMTMSWHDLLFAHWSVPVTALRALVPSSLQLDLWQGEAYVAVVPFRMTHVTGRGLPDLPFVSAFPELNVRTYVVHDGKPGVFFFSLDATSALAVWGARTLFHLPYLEADMVCEADGDAIRYRCQRTDTRGQPADARFVGRYGPSGPVSVATPGSLEHFLTERYCLYAVDGGGAVHRGEIHHGPWPLQPAFAEIVDNTMAPVSLAVAGAPRLLHFVRRIDVLGWALEGAP